MKHDKDSLSFREICNDTLSELDRIRSEAGLPPEIVKRRLVDSDGNVLIDIDPLTHTIDRSDGEVVS